MVLGSRTLYSDETLNLVRYRQVRFDAQCNVTGPERFKWELKTYLQNVRPLERDRVTKAYENLVYMVNKTPDDLDLLKEAMHAVAKFEKSLPKAFKHTLGNLSIKALYVIGDEDTANTVSSCNLLFYTILWYFKNCLYISVDVGAIIESIFWRLWRLASFLRYAV